MKVSPLFGVRHPLSPPAVYPTVTILLIMLSSGMKIESAVKLEGAENVHPWFPAPNLLLGASKKGGFDRTTLLMTPLGSDRCGCCADREGVGAGGTAIFL